MAEVCHARLNTGEGRVLPIGIASSTSIRTPAAKIHYFTEELLPDPHSPPRLRSMRDTLPDAELVRRDAVRRLDPRERLRQAFELSDTLRRMRSADGVERPEASPSAESDRPDSLDHPR